MNSAEIGKMLNMKPTIHRDVGMPRKTPKGHLLEGINPSTYCTYHLSEGDSSRFRSAVRKWNRRLLAKGRHIQKINRTGGHLEYHIGVFIEKNSGLNLDAEVIKELANLNIELDLGIYPPER